MEEYKMDIIGLSILKGIISFFLHPLTYITLIGAFILGLSRVKRDRRDFHTRVHDALDDVAFAIVPGIIAGAAFLVVNVFLGITLPFSTTIALSMAAFLLLVTKQIRFLSPAFTFILPVVAALFYTPIDFGSARINSFQDGIGSASMIAIVLLVGFLVMMEGLLISRNAVSQTSPRLVESKRGKLVGGHEVQRLWLIPLFLFLPVGNVEAFSWWPLLHFGDQAYSFLLMPLPIGFQKLIHHALPVPELKRNGRQVLLLGVSAVIIGLVSYFTNNEWLALIMLGIVVVMRATILLLHRGKDKAAYFNERNEGLVILGILPESPADHMNLQVGEVISKVNGIPVGKGTDFYTALQRNAAFCKLEVLDFNGEVRFEQKALYYNEHHELGLLFVKEHRLHDIEEAQ
ncbi:PDZ domain-containing protein [Pseudalkalibacillus hwajinpoensis]|uniref:PDZ domain-containing protein n=1 Tax=Guptibacillus hwajinpoensis TaxID=208199 RepID=A0A4U1MKA9_9BACL|nr:PDZ domain-containing protein [Pseudalkalibacillus hwajinpoensis]TKD70996.1 PDZ domain-containing protein [Pseudalkalibacillus hwajinpoensis]